MVRNSEVCCVPNCGKTRSDSVTLHKFPSPVTDPDRFRSWIDSIGGDVLSLDKQWIYQNRKVCHIHFEQKYILYTRGNRLSNIAVPTLYLKEVPIQSASLQNASDSQQASQDAPSVPLIKNKYRDNTSQPTTSVTAAGVKMEELHSCRCCLRGAPDKDLTTPYTHLGKTEIYSDMLKDCFDIQMSLDDGDCGICWVCVDRLRDATDFKLQVQRCQGELLALKGEGHVKDVEPVIKSENDVTMENDKVLELSYDRDKVKLETEEEDDTAGKDDMENKDETNEVPVVIVKSEQPDGDVEMADDEGSPTGADADADDPESEAEADDVANDEDFQPDSDHEESDVGSAGSDEVEDGAGDEDVGGAGDEDSSGPVNEDSVDPRVSRSRKRSADGRGQRQMALVQTSSTATDENRQKSTRIRTKDFCFFCETEVLNFARHVFRKHSIESDVQKILSYPKKSCTRKSLLTNLRKKGNYLANVSKCVKPMKKSGLHNDYLPCKNCLGYYSRKQLWKHKKSCQPVSEMHLQVEAQNLMFRNLNVDKKLKKEVLSKMRPDRVSLEAKKDPLICEFGARYLRMHQEKHFINVTSRKMRELAKLLIELRKLKPGLKDLMDYLKPQNYDIIVTAAKNVASYDDTLDRNSAPTYDMDISTSLKECCNIAITNIFKSGSAVQTAPMQAEVNALIQLIDANWKFDVPDQACSDLNLKKSNRITVLTLTSDLKLLKDHLCEKAKMAVSKLTAESTDVEAYTALMETVYCRVILLNTRRSDELQRLLLGTYQECRNEKACEKFDSAFSPTERLLINGFKRIIIRGERGLVPVLFSDDIQNDINLLISVRRKYISDTNKFLFAKPGCETPLCGHKVLEKYAKTCGAKNSKAITMTKLRTYLATIMQVMYLNDLGIEQLINSMGLTQSVLRPNYRLPEDFGQKISKLMLLEKGKADNYEGKVLDDIDLDFEQDLIQEIVDDNENDVAEYDDIIPKELRELSELNANEDINRPLSNVRNANTPNTPAIVVTTKKKRNVVPWTPEQKNIVINFFSKHIKTKRPPKRHECDELRALHPNVLHNKDWLKIKVFVQNIYTKKS